MIRIALTFGLAVAVLSQCPPPSTCPGSGAEGGSGSGCGGGSGDGSDNTTCNRPAITIQLTISEIMQTQPVFFTFMPNTSEYTSMDSKCLTLFPLPDNTETATCYESTVYTNGTSTVETFTCYFNSSDNTLIFANPDRTYVVYILGYAGCGTNVNYRCGTYGDNVAPFVYGVGPAPGGCAGNGAGKLGISCLVKAQTIVAAAGLTPPEGYYVLPYNLPTNCTVQQLCVPKDNPIYSQQAGQCLPYEESSAIKCP